MNIKIFVHAGIRLCDPKMYADPTVLFRSKLSKFTLLAIEKTFTHQFTTLANAVFSHRPLQQTLSNSVPCKVHTFSQPR
jgi:hypothetical protein